MPANIRLVYDQIKEEGIIQRRKLMNGKDKHDCTAETGCDKYCLYKTTQFECNPKNCKIKNCGNTPFRSGVVEVLEESPRRYYKHVGKGVVASRDIKPDEIIAEYCGTVISPDNLFDGVEGKRSHYYAYLETKNRLVIDAGENGSRGYTIFLYFIYWFS